MLADSAILKKIEKQPKRSAGFKLLVKELGLHGEARKELAERLQQLVTSGHLLQVDSGRYAIPQPASGKNMVVGRLRDRVAPRSQLTPRPAEDAPFRRHFHPAPVRWFCHARRPGAG